MISIIIPTYNEAESIQQLIAYLLIHGGTGLKEIIVADGGSTDNTLQLAAEAGATAVVSPLKGRAAQMNYGASLAMGNCLYFIHADTYPPPTFSTDIQQAIEKGYGVGRYRTRFDTDKWLLKINAFFTRFDLFVCFGGDQTLFISKELFQNIGGYDVNLLIMEDYEIVVRARKNAAYRIIPKNALISARKYKNNSWWRVQKANFVVVRMFKKGAGQQSMLGRYKALLRGER